MSKVLTVVHAYAGDAHQVETFMPYWLHHGGDVLLLSPEDAPVAYEHERVIYESAGERGWKGPQTIWRQLAHWKLAADMSFDYVLLNDADSLCLTPELPAYLFSEPDTIWCNVLCHENEHQPDDHPNLNPPYWMSHETLDKLIGAADELGEVPQDAFLEPHDWGQAIDGFYTHLVMDVLGRPWKDFFDGATTWPRGIQGLMDGCRRGARFLHGVKNSTHLAMVNLEYGIYQQSISAPQAGTAEGERITI